jgi:hypothetical protein
MRRFQGILAAGTACAGLVTLFAVLGGCGDDTTPAPTPGKHGSLLNAQEFLATPQALPVEALAQPPVAAVLPAKVRLTNIPEASTQGTPQDPGSPGTCEAQAFGYGLGTYTAARAPDGSIKWDAAQAGNQVSAAYQFSLAMENGFATCPDGGNATVYLSRLAGFGSPTATDVPYQPSCPYLRDVNLDKAYPDAPRLRIGSFATFTIDNATGSSSVGLIKAYLNNGQAVAFSGLVFDSYNNPSVVDGVFYGPEKYVPNDGHGQMLVGYDDTVGQTGRQGALLVQNSYGPQWPSAYGANAEGRLYWSYETFRVSQKFAAVAYPYDPSPPTGIMMTSNPSTAPVAAVKRAFQWSPSGSKESFLIFTVHLADPVRITAVTVREPQPGGATAVGGYGQYISNGYTYFKRTDGREFLPGYYDLKYQVQLLDGTPATYTAIVQIGTAAPNPLPAASLVHAENSLYDTTLAIATVTP